MALNFGLHLEQKQKLIMTPELRQAIEILQLSSFELNNLIAQELEKNPIIEIKEESPDFNEVESKNQEIDWEQYFQHNEPYYSSGSINYEEQEYSQENFVKDHTTLKDHLMFQLNILDLPYNCRKIGEFIIESINNNGYLTIEIDEIAAILNENKDDIKNILDIIQSFDPPGIGARDIRECLIIQLKQSQYWDETMEKIVGLYLEDLANNRFQTISKDLNLSFEEIQNIKDFLKTLEPKPGRLFPGKNEVRYITPDAFIREVGNEYIIIINDSTAPRLEINDFYKNILKSENSSSITSKYLKEKLESAMWLIKNIEQRRNTLYNVISAILEFQINFFKEGVKSLKPLTLRQIAEKLDIHESTVSRATNGKYVQTPMGLYELKYFFNWGIENQNGNVISSISIKDMIKDIISKENVLKPVSDQEIANILIKQGIKISRRTIAKYRDELGILSSSKRKRYE